MAEQTNAKPKKQTWLNPFQKFENRKQALSAAKSGAVVSIYLVLSYAIQIAFLHWGGKDTYGNQSQAATVTDVVAIVLAAFLTWRILVKQPLWASIVVALWFFFELAFKAYAMFRGIQPANGSFIFMFIALIIGAILSVRGSWYLRSAPDIDDKVFS